MYEGMRSEKERENKVKSIGKVIKVKGVENSYEEKDKG